MRDNPRHLERAWLSMVAATGLTDAPKDQLREMRMAFFAGARSYSRIVMSRAEAGDDATENDMLLMQHLDDEMEAFIVDVVANIEVAGNG